MGQDRSSVSCDDEGEPSRRPDHRSDWERREAELADTRELAEAVATSVVIHAGKIEALHRRIEALEARAGPDFKRDRDSEGG
jgi:primosomal protein N''